MKAGLKQCISRGYVLCGGGAQYENIFGIVESVCARPVRAGSLLQDRNVEMTQAWLGSAGLVYYIQQQGGQQVFNSNNPCRRAFKMLQRWLELYF